MALASSDQSRLLQAIGPQGQAEAGISDSSFADARVFPVVNGASMYVIAGSTGVCVVLMNGSTCGDFTSAHEIGQVLTNRKTHSAVAAGITDSTVSSVTVNVDGTASKANVVNGTYVITGSAGLRPHSSVPRHISVTGR